MPEGGILSASGGDSKCQWGGGGGGDSKYQRGDSKYQRGDSKCQRGGF